MKNNRLELDQVIARAGLIDNNEHYYMHRYTGAVGTGSEWIRTLRECDPELDEAFDPNGEGAALIEVVNNDNGEWVEA